ncbi:hypothetical protein [Massilia sp. H6]|uniref:hypothetical protein n=1 Tax=Massilia sp. H6 TaxID=2970464 RepID=UPI00216A0D81|nr:hypothetical protein [Massilia sp. H6]UVW27404.1 hypothetical protein NRS07_12625 [Massilia sp. H6]
MSEDDRIEPRLARSSLGQARPGIAEAQLAATALAPGLDGMGFTYRHDWGSRHGEWLLRLNWADLSARSQVFVAVGEGMPGGRDEGKFIGGARYTVHNVAPRAGGVDIWVSIDWNEDIPLFVDYLVVNPANPPTRTVQVTVQRHASVALSEADADRILADMGSTLQNADSGTDVATRVRFVRDGAVKVLPATIAASIQTEAQLLDLLNAGTGIKLVQAIRWCGGPGGSIIGCAPLGSPTVNVAAVRFTPDQEGILWVHEYGHNAGIGHRADERRAVMYPSIGSDHNVVNDAESERFLAGPVTLAGVGSVMPACACEVEGIDAPADVRDFVTRHWIEGIPYELASQYTENDARLLLQWLVDEPERHDEFLPEIVTTLCFIASPAAVEPLLDFVRSARAGRAAFNARHAVLIHLGDLVNRSGSQAALDFLTLVATGSETAIALAKAQVANAAAAAELAARGVDQLAAELAVSATFGLALAATPAAQQTIDALRDAPDAVDAVRQAAAEAAKLCRTVRAQGQKAYYRAKSAR